MRQNTAAATATATATGYIAQSELSHHSFEEHEAWYKQAFLNAIDLEKLFNNSTPIIAQVAEDAITAQILASLRSYYQTKNTKVSMPGKEIGLNLSEAFVRLALVNQISSQLRPETNNHILVLGEPGVGKSILAQYMAYQWAINKTPTNKFQAVFLLSLKMLEKALGFNFGTILSDACMDASADKISSDTLETWIETHKNEVLFILDGYDEVAALTWSSHSVVTKVIKKILSYPNVLLTSRPYQYNKILNEPFTSVFPRVYRNIGFQNEDISCYINKYFENETNSIALQQGLINWLNQHPIAKSISRIPLQLGMLCSLWNKTKGVGLEKPSLTHLYNKITEENFNALKPTPTSIRRETIEKFLMHLAYQAMEKSNGFSSNEICKVLDPIIKITEPNVSRDDIFKNILELGLFKSTKGLPNLDDNETYYFVHLTYQEYYAAKYIADLFEGIKEGKKRVEVDRLIVNNKYVERFERTWWFTAGLLAIRHLNAEDSQKTTTKDALIYFFDGLQQSGRDLVGAYELGLLVRCVEETLTQSDNININDFCGNIIPRLEAGVKILQKSYNILTGIKQASTDAIIFLNQLQLSPNICTNINANTILITKRESKQINLQQTLLEKLMRNLNDRWGVLSPFLYGLSHLILNFSPSEREKTINNLLEQLTDCETQVSSNVIEVLNQLAIKSAISTSQQETVAHNVIDCYFGYGNRYWAEYFGTITDSVSSVVGQLARHFSQSQRSVLVEKLINKIEISKHLHFIILCLSKILPTIPLPCDQQSLVFNLLKILENQNNDPAIRHLAAKALCQPKVNLSESEQNLVQKFLFHELEHQVSFENPIEDLIVLLVEKFSKSKQEKLISTLLPKVNTASTASTASTAYILTKITMPDTLTSSENQEGNSSVVASTCYTVYKNNFSTWLGDPKKRSLIIKFSNLLMGTIDENQRIIMTTKLLYYIGPPNYLNIDGVADVLEKLVTSNTNEHEQTTVINSLLKLLHHKPDAIQESVVSSLGKLRSIIPEHQQTTIVKALLKYLGLNEDIREPRVVKAIIITLGQFAQTVTNEMKPLVILSLSPYIFDPTNINFNNLINTFEQYYLSTANFYYYVALLLFHTEVRVKEGAWLLLEPCFLKKTIDWRFRQLLSLAGVVCDIKDQSAITFNQAPLGEISELLTLILSVCDIPEFGDRLCFVVIYLCFAHQLVLTVEPKTDASSEVYFKLTYQNKSEKINLLPNKMESAITGLRKVYLNDVKLNDHDKVFPPVKSLVRDQHLWRFFHIPPELSETNLLPSFISDNSKDTVSSKRWRVGVGCKEIEHFHWKNLNWEDLRRNFGHAFLIIEGVDQYDRGIYFRYDLCLKNPDVPAEGYHVAFIKRHDLKEEERERILHSDIQRNGKANYVSWELNCGTENSEVSMLITNIENDREIDLTQYYNSLPLSGSSTTANSTNPVDRQINCFIWARDHIKEIIGDKYKNELDGVPIPTLRIRTVTPPSEQSMCLIC